MILEELGEAIGEPIEIGLSDIFRPTEGMKTVREYQEDKIEVNTRLMNLVGLSEEHIADANKQTRRYNESLTQLEVWSGVNKLMGEAMPLITDCLRHEMRPQDLEELNSMDEVITVYRGMSEREAKEGGVTRQSWTTSLEVAEFFATKHGSNSRGKRVVKREVKQSDILAYIDDRNEKEVILRRAG